MGVIPLKPPKLPETLPFESSVGRALLKVSQAIDNSPPVRAVNKIASKVPYFPEQEMSTPFGKVTLPELSLPQVHAPEMSPSHKAALKAGIGVDVAGLIEFIPVAGPLLAEPIADTYAARINDALPPEEYKRYLSWEKKSPLSIIAVLQTIARQKP